MVFGYAGRGNGGDPSVESGGGGAEPGGRAWHPSWMVARSSAMVLTWNSRAPSFWSAYIAARASVNASIASTRFCKTWTRQFRRRISAEMTFSATAVFSSLIRPKIQDAEGYLLRMVNGL